MKTERLDALAEELSGKDSVFYKAYSESDNLADAVREYVNAIYGEKGLIVLDGDEKSLKNEFKSVIEEDVFHNSANNQVEKRSKELNDLGYKTQTYPREINFFYLKDNIRERIVNENGDFKVLNTDIQFTKAEIKTEIENHPERFSPNVILRPVYQEVILPNLAYTGGPAEVAYWLQLKPVFDHLKLAFPILLPRNFGMIIPNKIVETTAIMM
jgi:uncharacterized protein YllA (UPF0747 family)